MGGRRGAGPQRGRLPRVAADRGDRRRSSRAAAEVVRRGRRRGGRRAHHPVARADLRPGRAGGRASRPGQFTKGGARPGDVLVLSKPLGTGLALAGGDRRARRRPPSPACAGSTGRPPRRLRRSAPTVHAVTDVTGFGLRGPRLGDGRALRVRDLAFDARLAAALPPASLAAAAPGVRTGRRRAQPRLRRRPRRPRPRDPAPRRCGVRPADLRRAARRGRPRCSSASLAADGFVGRWGTVGAGPARVVACGDPRAGPSDTPALGRRPGPLAGRVRAAPPVRVDAARAAIARGRRRRRRRRRSSACGPACSSRWSTRPACCCTPTSGRAPYAVDQSRRATATSSWTSTPASAASRRDHVGAAAGPGVRGRGRRWWSTTGRRPCCWPWPRSPRGGRWRCPEASWSRSAAASASPRSWRCRAPAWSRWGPPTAPAGADYAPRSSRAGRPPASAAQGAHVELPDRGLHRVGRPSPSWPRVGPPVDGRRWAPGCSTPRARGCPAGRRRGWRASRRPPDAWTAGAGARDVLGRQAARRPAGRACIVGRPTWSTPAPRHPLYRVAAPGRAGPRGAAGRRRSPTSTARPAELPFWRMATATGRAVAGRGPMRWSPPRAPPAPRSARAVRRRWPAAGTLPGVEIPSWGIRVRRRPRRGPPPRAGLRP